MQVEGIHFELIEFSIGRVTCSGESASVAFVNLLSFLFRLQRCTYGLIYLFFDYLHFLILDSWILVFDAEGWAPIGMG